jgi:hypothetical protein
MTIPFGRYQLIVLVTRTGRQKPWEELTAVGMGDRELAHLNEANTRYLDVAAWDGPLSRIDTRRRP